MTVKQLHRAWLWTTVLALVAFAILAWFETKLGAATGYNMRSLQFATTPSDFDRIATAFIARPNALIAGFSLGFDYLFMPLYAFAFYYSGLIVRERFAPKPGLPRRVMQFVAAIPLAGMLFDMTENALETKILIFGATDKLAGIAYSATNLKMICFYIGLALLLAAIVVRLTSRKSPVEAA